MTRAKNALIMGVAGNANTIAALLPKFVSLPFTAGTLKKAVTTQSKDHAQKDDKPFSAKCHDFGKKIISPKKETTSFAATEIGTLFHKAAFLLNGFTDDAVEQALKEALVYNGAFIGEKDRQEIAGYLKKLVKTETTFTLSVSGREFISLIISSTR